MKLNFITLDEFTYILNKKKMSVTDKFRLASYPYISLTSYCRNIGKYERKQIQKIEERNIYHFFNAIHILFDGTLEKDEAFQNCFTCEPFRTAVIIANQEHNASMKIPTLIKYSCLILLSMGKAGTTASNPINVKIDGKMPSYLIFSRQELGNQWFRNFINYKLDAMCEVCKNFNLEDAFIFLSRSIAYSLSFFRPMKYDVSMCSNEDEAIKHILRVFINSDFE